MKIKFNRTMMYSCNSPRASSHHFNYFRYELISKDTQLQLWNSLTEPNKTEGTLALRENVNHQKDPGPGPGTYD